MRNTVGQESVQEIHREIDRAIKSTLNVILEGENGVGKDHFARMIHESRNWGGEFVVYDCECSIRDRTRIVEEFISSVVFQKLLRSKKNTFLIRRIDLLQPHLLSRLSDFVDELDKRGAFRRSEILTLGIIGSLQTSEHKRSPANTKLDKFLSRLFRLKITVPPLRERKKEIPQLVQRYISLFNKEQKRNVLGITSEALEILLQYDWPDNICELRREIEGAATLTKDYGSIKPSSLSEILTESVLEKNRIPSQK